MQGEGQGQVVLQNNTIAYDKLGRVVSVFDGVTTVRWSTTTAVMVHTHSVYVKQDKLSNAEIRVDQDLYNSYDKMNRQLIVDGVAIVSRQTAVLSPKLTSITAISSATMAQVAIASDTSYGKGLKTI